MSLVLYEGLLGGAVYVNAFYTISMDVSRLHKSIAGLFALANEVGVDKVIGIKQQMSGCGLPRECWGRGGVAKLNNQKPTPFL